MKRNNFKEKSQTWNTLKQLGNPDRIKWQTSEAIMQLSIDKINKNTFNFDK